MKGRIVLVTGATQGIGLAIAKGAAAQGAKAVVIVGRDPDKGAAAAKTVESAGATCAFVAADLATAAAPDAIFEAALQRFGHVDVLVNSTGLTDRGAASDANLELWERLYAVNARAPLFLMQKLINHLCSRGAPSLSVYGSTKAALAALTKNVAHAHRFDRIRANAINVGWVDTPAERQMQAVTLGKGGGWAAEASAQQPFGRLLTPEDVARLAVFLAGEASEPMTGAVIDQEQFVIGAFG